MDGTAARRWTTPADIVAVLRRRWDSGSLLTTYASARDWSAVVLPIRGPSARELVDDYAAVSAWIRGWQPSPRRPWRVETRSVGGRHAGVNELPSRVWFDEPTKLWAALEVSADVDRFADLLATAERDAPRLADWIRTHPKRVLGFGDDWARLVRATLWIDDFARPGMYLRQIDVPGVDTKFIEAHRGALAELLDLQLSDARVDSRCSRSDLEGRYAFQRKPAYVRFRPSVEDPRFGSLAEITVRVSDFKTLAPAGSTVIIVENDVSYLALPAMPDTMIVFGSGYALSVLGGASWLADRELVYWGDIDTHGFVILDRLRRHWTSARSILMDRKTLLEHSTQWVHEPTPVAVALEHLHHAEAALYRDLVEDSFGPSVRLEQERIRFSSVERAVDYVRDLAD